jgi:hypothetical protein
MEFAAACPSLRSVYFASLLWPDVSEDMSAHGVPCFPKDWSISTSALNFSTGSRLLPDCYMIICGLLLAVDRGTSCSVMFCALAVLSSVV